MKIPKKKEMKALQIVILFLLALFLTYVCVQFGYRKYDTRNCVKCKNETPVVWAVPGVHEAAETDDDEIKPSDQDGETEVCKPHLE
jgi:hypothetical protein